ncbi:MAG: hypothetical protein WCO66_02145 [Candidatus Absconditabacteria bacterium]
MVCLVDGCLPAVFGGVCIANISLNGLVFSYNIKTHLKNGGAFLNEGFYFAPNLFTLPVPWHRVHGPSAMVHLPFSNLFAFLCPLPLHAVQVFSTDFT